MKKVLLLLVLSVSINSLFAQWGGERRQCQPRNCRPNFSGPRVFFNPGRGCGNFGPRINVIIAPRPRVVYAEPAPSPPPPPQPRIERVWVEGHYEEGQYGRVWVEGHYIQREVY